MRRAIEPNVSSGLLVQGPYPRVFSAPLRHSRMRLQALSDIQQRASQPSQG